MNRPKVSAAVSYLDQVKARFSDQTAILIAFLDVMRQFKAQAIGVDVVICRVRELFEGHQELIVGFNTFIPQEYRLESSVHPSESIGTTVPLVGPTNTTDTSPGKLPSFSAFRHIDSSQNANSPAVSSTITYEPTAQSTELPSFYTSSGLQPPVLRSHLSAGSSQQQPMSQGYHTMALSANQSLIENHGGFSAVLPSPQTPFVPGPHQHNTQSFNHAIVYVNKVKNRFQTNPDVYERFLEILQWYQREQDHTDPIYRKQAELQVYQEVAKLLHGHDDLLQEFGRFLPESTGIASDVHDSTSGRNQQYCSVSELSSAVHNRFSSNSTIPPFETTSWRRTPADSQVVADSKKPARAAFPASQVYSQNEPVPVKKSRQSTRDISISDDFASRPEFILLQKIRNALGAESGTGNHSYQTLLQNINLLNRKLITEKQLIEAGNVILHRHPDLFRQFSDLINELQSELRSFETEFNMQEPESVALSIRGFHDDDKRYQTACSITSPPSSEATTTGANNVHPLTGADMVALVSEVSQKRLDLDFNKLRVCGASYRALPSNFPQPKCSGRASSSIARTVLNDTYISFSSLTSEDSQFVSSKKNQYEENMYHTEDERYEADMVMEVNRAALQSLIIVRRRLDRMGRDEQQAFRLDDCLGGTSAILMKKAIHRVYGDKAADVVFGLKTCPNTVVSIVIERMRQKDNEWREAVRKFQQFWSDQDSKNYLRSLDHQSVNFKQRDNAFSRPKTLINHIECIARDSTFSSEFASGDVVGTMIARCLTSCSPSLLSISPATLGSASNYVIEGECGAGGAHLTLDYPSPDVCASLLQDVSSLIIHHVKRLSSTSKEDKRTMKFIVRTVLQDFLMQDRFPMSDDEADDEDCNGNDDEGDCGSEKNFSDAVDNECDAGVTAILSDVNAKQSRRISRHSRRLQIQEQSNGFVESTTMLSNMAYWKPPSASFTNADDMDLHPDFLIDISTKLPPEECYCLLYGNNQWYAFIRLHHLLLTRLSQLRARAQLLQQEYLKESRKIPVQVADALRLRKQGHTEPKDYYEIALQLVKDLLDGCEDVHSYEDRLREMFGIYAYPWFTMDRLITNLVRQLNILASGDELGFRLTSLFRSHIKCPSGSSQNDYASVTTDIDRGNCSPVLSGIGGLLRARYSRLKEEARYQHMAFSLCLEMAPASNDDNGVPLNDGFAVVQTHPLTNCYALVMLRQASKLLIRLVDPSYIVNTYVSTHQSPNRVPLYHHPRPTRPPSFTEEARAANALRRANAENPHEVRHWYDYLARYLLIPGCWTAGPVSPALVASVRPVFLYRNVRRCLDKLTFQALQRRKRDIIATGDPQPEEVILHRLAKEVKSKDDNIEQLSDLTKTQDTSTGEESIISNNDLIAGGNNEKDTWELMVRVLQNSLTRSEVFCDTFSCDFMQSSKNLKSTATASKAIHKINWSVGSYDVFIRFKKSCPEQLDARHRSAEKFRKFQSFWIREHGDENSIAAVIAQLKQTSNLKDDAKSREETFDTIEEQKEILNIHDAAKTTKSDVEVTKIDTPTEVSPAIAKQKVPVMQPENLQMCASAKIDLSATGALIPSDLPSGILAVKKI